MENEKEPQSVKISVQTISSNEVKNVEFVVKIDFDALLINCARYNYSIKKVISHVKNAILYMENNMARRLDVPFLHGPGPSCMFLAITFKTRLS